MSDDRFISIARLRHAVQPAVFSSHNSRRRCSVVCFGGLLRRCTGTRTTQTPNVFHMTLDASISLLKCHCRIFFSFCVQREATQRSAQTATQKKEIHCLFGRRSAATIQIAGNIFFFFFSSLRGFRILMSIKIFIYLFFAFGWDWRCWTPTATKWNKHKYFP